MTRALICGVSGQDGAYLAECLLGQGYEVFGSTRADPTLAPANLAALGLAGRVKMVELDAVNPLDVRRTLEEVRPDEIYSLTGPSSVAASFHNPQESFQSITVGTVNLLDAVRQIVPKARVFLAGSSECFGNTTVPATEETPFSPRSPYAISKISAHWTANIYREGYGLFVCTGFLFNHESVLRTERYVTQKVIATACRIKAGSDEKLNLGNTTIARDWGWAPEYVQAMWRMLQQDEPRDFIIATGQTHTLEEFVARTFAKLDLDAGDHVDTDPALLRPTDIVTSHGNPAKARQILGWRPAFAFDEIIAEMIAAKRQGSQ
jgi:GDPmannose 4,6-dehydratase